MRDALASLKVNTIIGGYAADSHGMIVKNFPLLTGQWQDNQKEIVWPEDSRTAKPVLNRP